MALRSNGLGMFAACSNDMPDNGPVISRDGDYMAVSINLPTVASTRAVNDNYDDGKPDEYKVNNGCLVIFKGEPDGEEKDAKFAAAYRLNGLDASETPDDKDETPVDNITTSYKKSVKLENLEYNENDKLYAFVMLNYIGIATVDESNSQLTVKGKDGDISADGNTFAQIFLTETKEDSIAMAREILKRTSSCVTHHCLPHLVTSINRTSLKVSQ